jgi:histidinol dehydrogenase
MVTSNRELMKRILVSDTEYERELTGLAGTSSLFDEEIERRTRVIIQSVLNKGDEALLELGKKFDGAELTTEDLCVTPEEIRRASAALTRTLRASLGAARKNIFEFSRHSLRKSWSRTNSQGGIVGERFEGFHRVGIYIPGGTAPLVSTVLMTVTLARVAGVSEIAVCTPCGRDGSVHPAILSAAQLAGTTEIYKNPPGR